MTKFHSQNKQLLTSARISTPLGPMIAIADEHALRLLEFLDFKNLEPRIKNLTQQTESTIIEGKTAHLISIEHELDLYFKSCLKDFNTPIAPLGTPFQLNVWRTLRTIPFGTTASYADLAKHIGKPTAFRAVAQANGANQFPIIIPCHRIINANGKLGGYSSGLTRKQWLLDHEKE